MDELQEAIDALKATTADFVLSAVKTGSPMAVLRSMSPARFLAHLGGLKVSELHAQTCINAAQCFADLGRQGLDQQAAIARMVKDGWVNRLVAHMNPEGAL